MATKDARGRYQWTLKDTRLDEEFQNLVRKAAERQGQSLTIYVYETMRERSLEVLKGERSPAGPPARREDVTDTLSVLLADAIEKLRQEQAERDWAAAERMERVEREMAEQRARMERQWAEEQRAVRRGRWWR